MNYEEKILAEKEKLKRSEANIKRLRALQNKKQRAIETRKKILAGAALLNEYEKESDEEMKYFLIEILKKNLSSKDFEFIFPAVEVITEQPVLIVFGGKKDA